MIDKKALTDFIESRLENTDLFLVDVEVSPANEIKVEVDSMTGVDIDKCVELSREIEQQFDRDVEDYELEVGSVGITAPFKVRRQYEKNIGRDVEVIAGDGKKYKGTLLSAGEGSFTVAVEEKVKPEGAKRPVIRRVERSFNYSDVKQTKYLFQF